MAIFRPNLNTPIPNNPFYSPQTNTLQSATGPLIVGSGITVDYTTGIITAAGGGGGGSGTVTTVNTGSGLTGGPITSSGTISLTSTPVTPGTYNNATFTVDGNGRLTAASSGTPPVFSVTGVAPITVTGATARVVSIAVASTTGAGAVQLYNNTNSTSTALALTAAQGYSLQQQINALLIASNLTLAGTLDAATGLVLTATTDGTSQGFVSGSALPTPAVGNQDYFVIATVGGTFDPPGPTGPLTVTAGDWVLSSGTQWDLLDIGPTLLYATTTVAGTVCLSTNALAQAGTDTITALTPAAARSAYVPNVYYPAKGDLVGGTSVANTPVTVPIGTAGQVLTVDSTAPTGFTWKTGPAGTVTSVTTGTGLSGGIITSTGTIALANTSVVAGSYTNATLTVDAQGRLTAASSGVVAPAIPCACVTGKGALVTGTAAAAVVALPVGTNGQALVVDLTCPSGLKWDSVGVTAVTCVDTGTGLTGGPITSTGTIALANTAVGAGSYTNASFTVDAQGRLTAASSGTPCTGTVTSINTGTGLTGGPITTTGTIALANTAVGAGSYTYGSFTVDAQGRLTAASSGTPPLTALTGTAPIAVTTGTTPVVSIGCSSTTALGAVQLTNALNDTSETLALTACAGKSLQDQITALVVTGSIELAGTIDASTGLVDSVTSVGTANGYTVGAVLPAADAVTANSYVIATTAGTMTPPGGSSTVVTKGDWFLASETAPGVYSWQFLNVGFDTVPATTTVAGIVCLSTNALAQAGVDATTALTPAAAASAYIPRACVTAKGDLITGTAVDTPTALTVGTDDQILVACSTAATGLCWATAPYIPCSCITAKGTLITGTGANAPVPLAVGTDGQALVACSTSPNGLCWSTSAVSPATPTVCGIVLGCTDATNSALGCIALFSNTSGTGNIAVGLCSLRSNTTGINNVAIGNNAFGANTGGSGNVAIGTAALQNVINDNRMVAIGEQALCASTGGTYNVALGWSALCSQTSGGSNVALGALAGNNITTGSSNVIIGPNVTVPFGNQDAQLAIGYNAGLCWLTGDSSRNVKFWAGIRANNDSLGSSGQVLTSTGSGVQWASAGAGDWIGAGQIGFSKPVGMSTASGGFVITRANYNGVWMQQIGPRNWNMIYQIRAIDTQLAQNPSDFVFSLPNGMSFDLSQPWQNVFTGNVQVSSHANRQYMLPTSVTSQFNAGSNTGSQFGSGVIPWSGTQFRFMITDGGNGGPRAWGSNYWNNTDTSISIGFQFQSSS